MGGRLPIAPLALRPLPAGCEPKPLVSRRPYGVMVESYWE